MRYTEKIIFRVTVETKRLFEEKASQMKIKPTELARRAIIKELARD